MLLFQFLLLSGFNHKHYITELEIITMRLYPAIDIKDGQCVRLKKDYLMRLLYILISHMK